MNFHSFLLIINRKIVLMRFLITFSTFSAQLSCLARQSLYQEYNCLYWIHFLKFLWFINLCFVLFLISKIVLSYPSILIWLCCIHLSMFREICSECRVLLFLFKEPELSWHILEIEYQNKTSNKCIQENKTSNKCIQENKTSNKRIQENKTSNKRIQENKTSTNKCIQENKTSNKCFQEKKRPLRKKGILLTSHNRYNWMASCNLSTFISLFFIIQVLLKD